MDVSVAHIEALTSIDFGRAVRASDTFIGGGAAREVVSLTDILRSGARNAHEGEAAQAR